MDNIFVEKPDYFYICQEETQAKQKALSSKSKSSHEKSKTKKLTDKRKTSNNSSSNRNSYNTDDIRKSPKERLSETEDDEERRSAYESLLNDFVLSDKREIVFPPDLNSYERMIIHKIADGLDLFHESRDSGTERHVYICKRTVIYDTNKRNSPNGNKRTRADLVQSDISITKSSRSSSEDSLETQIVEDMKKLSSTENDNSKIKKEVDSQLLSNCPNCWKEIPSANYTLHTLHCGRKPNDQNYKVSFLSFIYIVF